MKTGKLLFLTNSTGGGGAERSINIVVNELHLMGVDVELGVFDEEVIDLIPPKCNVNVFDSGLKNKAIKRVHQYVRFNSYVRKRKPSVVIANCALPELMVALMISRISIVVVEHASKPWPRFQLLGRLIRKILVIRGVRWVKVSGHLNVWGLPKQNGVEINNPIVSNNLEKQTVRTPNIRRLVFIGRLSPEKNPQMFIEIVRTTQIPSLIIGSGKLMDKLQELVSSQELPINFAGHVVNPWLLFKEGDLLIVPSLNEGDGLVAIEAISNNQPLLLNSCKDLLRFELPEVNYCSTVIDYTERINQHRDNLLNLVVSPEIRYHIIKSREPKNVAIKWLNFLL